MKKSSNKYVCPHCGEEKDTEKQLYNHIYNAHRAFNKSVSEAMSLYSNKPKWILYNLDKEVLKEWFIRHKTYNNFVKLYDKQFSHFYDLITFIREWRNEDFDIFFGPFLDWKIKNPKVPNSIELCHIVFPNQPQIAQKLYNEKMKTKNPFTGHGKELSPFSKDFNGYKDMSEEEKEKAVLEATKHNVIGRNTNQKEYWIKKGYTEEEAIKKVSERQTTFSKEICIEKYGEKEGIKIWEERQKKWQATLNDKPDEEKERIARAKMNWGRGYSIISQKMFWEIYEKIKTKVDTNQIYFATYNRLSHKDDGTEKNYEYFYVTESGEHFFLDFLLKNKKRVVEFDGDYWHGEARGNQERDRKREKALKNAGFDILRISERDYKKHPVAMVYEAVQFLLED